MARITKERIIAQRIMEDTAYSGDNYYMDLDTIKATAGVCFTFESLTYTQIAFKARFDEDFKSTELLKVLKTGSTDIYCTVFIDPLEESGVKYNKATVRYYDYNKAAATDPDYKDYEIKLTPDIYHIFEIKGDSLVIDNEEVELEKSYPFTDASTVYYLTDVSAGEAYADFIWLIDATKTRKYYPKAMIKHVETTYTRGETEIEEEYLGVCYIFIDTDKSKTVVNITTGDKDSAVPAVVSCKRFMIGDREEDTSTTPSTYKAKYRTIMEKIS